MFKFLKAYFKKNSRNAILRSLSKLGLAINRQYENRNYDFHTNGEATVLKKLARFNPKTILDVGAASGEYSELVHAIIPFAKIFAFEPEEKVFQELEKKAQSGDWLTPISKGLFESSGEIPLYNYGESQHPSIIKLEGMKRAVSKEQKIEALSGDDFMADHGVERIDYLKIDVEGAEMNVIKGFAQAFLDHRITACQFEYGYANISAGYLLKDLYDFFTGHGYVVGKIYPGAVDFRDYHVKHEDFLGPNFLAVDGNQTELISFLSKI